MIIYERPEILLRLNGLSMLPAAFLTQLYINGKHFVDRRDYWGCSSWWCFWKRLTTRLRKKNHPTRFRLVPLFFLVWVDWIDPTLHFRPFDFLTWNIFLYRRYFIRFRCTNSWSMRCSVSARKSTTTNSSITSII